MPTKRTYTVPVLLVIATILVFVIVVLFSKLLLTEQSAKTDEGMRLASSYNYCTAFAGLLNNEVGNLANTADAVARLPVKEKIGQIGIALGECANVLYQAQTKNGVKKEDASAAISDVMQTLSGKLENLGNHDGRLTDEELATVKTMQAAGAEIGKTLQAYAVPTGNDRYRQMAAGAEWPGVAMQAFKQMQDLAAALK